MSDESPTPSLAERERIAIDAYFVGELDRPCKFDANDLDWWNKDAGEAYKPQYYALADRILAALDAPQQEPVAFGWLVEWSPGQFMVGDEHEAYNTLYRTPEAAERAAHEQRSFSDAWAGIRVLPVALYDRAIPPGEPAVQEQERRAQILEEAALMVEVSYQRKYIADHIRSLAGESVPTSEPSYVEFRSSRCHAGSDGDCSWDECPQLRDGEPRASGRHCPLASEPSAEAWCKSTHRGWDCELSANHAGNHHAWCEGYGAIDWDSEPAAVPDVPPRTLEDRGGLAGLWTADLPPREDQPHISDFRRHNRVPREPEEPQ